MPTLPTILQSPNITVPHGFSTRHGGVSTGYGATMNLRLQDHQSREDMLENYGRYCHAVGVDVTRTVLSHQVHTDNIRLATEADAGKGLFRDRGYEADGLITNAKNLPLVVFGADCGIALLHDPVNDAIGAVHGGWRGCAMGIMGKIVEEMTAQFDTDPAQLQVAMGPCIHQCCFETHTDVPEAMIAALGHQAMAYIAPKGEKFSVDLLGLNRQWLLNAGVLPIHIHIHAHCTACDQENFWSHRKLGDHRGVQCGMIALD
ncbi:peptidoglycan editing factor PgeF [Bengtsoniella intestinalis]|uniref:peptidoglycan editing factor PgeF n=1 Tax=Bengtsoniella intestinalis TaxID=3073143 RepID=UPI00391FB9A4